MTIPSISLEDTTTYSWDVRAEDEENAASTYFPPGGELMNGDAWARQEIVNVADVDLDGTPDLLFRDLDNGAMYIRHGRHGPVPGSVDLNSLKTAGASREGDVQYGTGWTETQMTAVIGIPDVNGDRVPDLWARSGTDGKIRIYHPSTTSTNAPVETLSSDWSSVKAFG